jgi:TRAP-type C4-dicarboxylate transport system permease small subunit
MGLKTRLWKSFDHMLEFMAVLGMVIMVLVMLVICYEVVTRYFLGRGSAWVIEFSEYALLYITFLGAGWLLRREGHVSMDILVLWFSPKRQILLNGIVSILGGILCGVFTWFGAEVALDHLVRGLRQPTLISPPDFPLLAVIPVGFFTLFVQFLRRAHRLLTSEELKKA